MSNAATCEMCSARPHTKKRATDDIAAIAASTAKRPRSAVPSMRSRTATKSTTNGTTSSSVDTTANALETAMAARAGRQRRATMRSPAENGGRCGSSDTVALDDMIVD